MTPKNTLLIFSVESKSAFNIVELQTAQTKGGKNTNLGAVQSSQSALFTQQKPKIQIIYHFMFVPAGGTPDVCVKTKTFI